MLKYKSLIDILMTKNYFITGGAGFIGAHLANYLLLKGNRVTIYDNLSNGHKWHLGENISNINLKLIEADVRDEKILDDAILGHDVVFHLASNADIARAVTDPDIDFSNGALLTRCVLEAMRKGGVRQIVFTSGSGVYGEVPTLPVSEDFSPMIPVSTYGAQKLASEALISAYCFMFDMHGMVFRFANVVGPQQTHGVAYDFLLKLSKTPTLLKIMGDGTQSKPYIHVEDVIDAFMTILEGEINNKSIYEYYNVASNDHLTVNQIADLVCEQMNLLNVQYEYSGGSRGWKADIPFYRLNTTKIRTKGWANKYGSREAVISAVKSMIMDIKAGKIRANQ
jgi:UDP-glucose 4-epimerase